jgi:hypothetical protein
VSTTQRAVQAFSQLWVQAAHDYVEWQKDNLLLHGPPRTIWDQISIGIQPVCFRTLFNYGRGLFAVTFAKIGTEIATF